MSAALVATGGLTGVYLLNASSDAAAVVALVKPVQRGEVIDRSDLTTARAIKDPAVHPVSADQLDSIVGKRAATDLPAGLLPKGAVTTDLVPAQGKSLVGLQLKLSQLPSSSLRPGDSVRLVELPPEGSTKKANPGQTTTATVVSSHIGEDGDSVRVDVELPSSSAASVATSAAQGRLALVVDSRER